MMSIDRDGHELRTSVALVRVLCARLFRIAPAIEAHSPDLNAMLDRADAALIIGDKALVWDPSNDMVRRAGTPIIRRLIWARRGPR
jgi:predicted solute-binding protein